MENLQKYLRRISWQFLLLTSVFAAFTGFIYAVNKYGLEDEGVFISLIVSTVPVFIAIAVGMAIGFVSRVNPMIYHTRDTLNKIPEQLGKKLGTAVNDEIHKTQKAMDDARTTLDGVHKIPEYLEKEIDRIALHYSCYTLNVVEDLRTALKRDVESIKAYAPSFGGSALKLIDVFFEETIEEGVKMEIVVGRSFAITNNKDKISFQLYEHDDISTCVFG